MNKLIKNHPVNIDKKRGSGGGSTSRNGNMSSRKRLSLSLAQEAKLIYAVPAGASYEELFKSKKDIIKSINIENGFNSTKVLNSNKKVSPRKLKSFKKKDIQPILIESNLNSVAPESAK